MTSRSLRPEPALWNIRQGAVRTSPDFERFYRVWGSRGSGFGVVWGECMTRHFNTFNPKPRSTVVRQGYIGLRYCHASCPWVYGVLLQGLGCRVKIV